MGLRVLSVSRCHGVLLDKRYIATVSVTVIPIHRHRSICLQNYPRLHETDLAKLSSTNYLDCVTVLDRLPVLALLWLRTIVHDF